VAINAISCAGRQSSCIIGSESAIPTSRDPFAGTPEEIADVEVLAPPMSGASWSSPADLVIANGHNQMDRSSNAQKAYRFRRRCG
jgi:hypothetical protein